MPGHGDYHEPQQQQPPQQYAQPYQQPHTGFAETFVGPGKLGMFLIFGAFFLFLGLLFLDLMLSGLVRESAVWFIGELLVHMGIVVMITLLMVAGIIRDDLPQETRNHMIRAAGFVTAAFVVMLFIRITGGISLY